MFEHNGEQLIYKNSNKILTTKSKNKTKSNNTEMKIGKEKNTRAIHSN